MYCPIQRVDNSEVVLDYCAGKLSSDAAAAFERHMDVCSHCRSLATGQQHVWQALDTWKPVQVSLQVNEDFDRKLYARIEAYESRSWWRRHWRPALSFGAACAAMAIAFVVYMPGNRSDKIDVEPEQVERALEDLEMLKLLSTNGGQTI